MSDRNWQARAACVGVDPELFFPTSRNDSAKSAKRICAGCPVKADCRQAATDNGEEFGVWGGRTEQERNGPKPSKAGRLSRAAENVAFVLRENPTFTSREVAERHDLRAQLDRNAAAVGLNVAASTSYRVEEAS